MDDGILGSTVGSPPIVEDSRELVAYCLINENLMEANVLLLDVRCLMGVGETPHLESEFDNYF